MTYIWNDRCTYSTHSLLWLQWMKRSITIKMVRIYIIEIFFITNTFNLLYRTKVRERERDLQKLARIAVCLLIFVSVSKIFANTTDSVMTIKTSYVRFKSSWWRNFYRCLSLQIHGIDSSLHSIVILNSVKSSIIFLTNPN